MGVEKGGPEQKGKIDTFLDKMQLLGWGVFAAMQAVAIVTTNPALSYAATKGALWDVTFDVNRKALKQTIDQRKKK